MEQIALTYSKEAYRRLQHCSSEVSFKEITQKQINAIFLEIAKEGMSLTQDFTEVNMHHIHHSDAAHNTIRGYSSYHALTSESSPRSNFAGIAVIPKRNKYVIVSKYYHTGDMIREDIYDAICIQAVSPNKPAWIPQFRQLHICDVIALRHQDSLLPENTSIVHSDSFFAQLQDKDQIDYYLSEDNDRHLINRCDIVMRVPDLFWTMFLELLPPSKTFSHVTSLPLMVEPTTLSKYCCNQFMERLPEMKQLHAQICMMTRNIIDRLVLGIHSISDDVHVSEV